IQYADAVHRAQFSNRMAPNWHTTLVPNVVDRVTFTIPRFVNVDLGQGNIIQARAYFTGAAPDGSRFVLMLRPLFNALFSNAVINKILTKAPFTTDANSSLMPPNIFLSDLNVNNPTTPGSCCVLGFHPFSRDQTAVPQPRFVAEYASWISPGLLGGGF